MHALVYKSFPSNTTDMAKIGISEFSGKNNFFPPANGYTGLFANVVITPRGGSGGLQNFIKRDVDGEVNESFVPPPLERKE